MRSLVVLASPLILSASAMANEFVNLRVKHEYSDKHGKFYTGHITRSVPVNQTEPVILVKYDDKDDVYQVNALVEKIDPEQYHLKFFVTLRRDGETVFESHPEIITANRDQGDLTVENENGKFKISASTSEPRAAEAKVKEAQPPAN